MSALEVRSLSKRFGGLSALEDVSFTILPNRIHAIIGPNGAGKTTLFNLITGLYTPDQGGISLFDQDITRLPVATRARLGLQRSFQNLQIFFNMSALENVMVGAQAVRPANILAGFFGLPSIARINSEEEALAKSLMQRVGLGAYLKSEASAMPYGALKRLEIARALAAKPRLLLLDEPAAGLNATEKLEIANLIREIASDGITVILVEHDMRLVMSVAEQVIVLDRGRKLAEGSPEAIRQNREVIEAYLGQAARQEASAPAAEDSHV